LSAAAAHGIGLEPAGPQALVTGYGQLPEPTIDAGVAALASVITRA
jgi:hypothetical protein